MTHLGFSDKKLTDLIVVKIVLTDSSFSEKGIQAFSVLNSAATYF